MFEVTLYGGPCDCSMTVFQALGLQLLQGRWGTAVYEVRKMTFEEVDDLYEEATLKHGAMHTEYAALFRGYLTGESIG